MTGPRIDRRWQLGGEGPWAYERYLVPAMFEPCADALLDFAGVGPGDHVLDLACGTGIVARRAALRVGAQGSVVGVDTNERMVAVAREVAARAADQPSIAWHHADATEVPAADAAFDVVCCQQGLQYFPDAPAALSEARRVIAPGGRLALAVWRPLEHNPIFTLLIGILERHAGPDTANLMRAPFGGPDDRELRRLVNQAGFGQATVDVRAIVATFPSAHDFLRMQVASSPLAGPVGELNAVTREELFADVTDKLREYHTDDGLSFPVQTWLVRAVAER